MNNWVSLLEWIIVLALVRVAYDTTTVKPIDRAAPVKADAAPVKGDEVNPRLKEMFSERRLKSIKAKELKKYQEMQDEKWRRWLESVSR